MTDGTCKEHSGLIQANEDLARTADRQQKAIEELQHRLPVWATLLISLLTGLLGFSVGVITMLAKNVHSAKLANTLDYLKGLI